MAWRSASFFGWRSLRLSASFFGWQKGKGLPMPTRDTLKTRMPYFLHTQRSQPEASGPVSERTVSATLCLGPVAYQRILIEHLSRLDPFVRDGEIVAWTNEREGDRVFAYAARPADSLALPKKANTSQSLQDALRGLFPR